MSTRKGREIDRINKLLNADPNREDGVQPVDTEEDDRINELENKINKATEEHEKEVEEKAEEEVEDTTIADRELLLEKREAEVAQAEKRFSKMGYVSPPHPEQVYEVNIPDEQKILSAAKKAEYEEQISEAELALAEEKNMQDNQSTTVHPR